MGPGVSAVRRTSGTYVYCTGSRGLRDVHLPRHCQIPPTARSPFGSDSVIRLRWVCCSVLPRDGTVPSHLAIVRTLLPAFYNPGSRVYGPDVAVRGYAPAFYHAWHHHDSRFTDLPAVRLTAVRPAWRTSTTIPQLPTILPHAHCLGTVTGLPPTFAGFPPRLSWTMPLGSGPLQAYLPAVAAGLPFTLLYRSPLALVSLRGVPAGCACLVVPYGFTATPLALPVRIPD